ncbi:hypothetical protein SLEP1_g21665 [Rubroshorea leprosula]|uniref:Uncharacterized protein n=1 Tax=Rubroshorea leprosula TaxID=152421 RepID=A0AAV5JFW8_9ROSI|nr:hypothetical protein SLEP1_g21665 [Rubroshorea leprosula]
MEAASTEPEPALTEGIRKLNVVVWKSNTLTADDHVGNGRVQLLKDLSQGFDDTNWLLQSKQGRLIRHSKNLLDQI